eukprot:Hpha_TRINITY_DN15364_c4_g2::TRINITY_DN15364_c4_g2_i1::g.91242::m.91242/K12385/NPC1; Niemann-Pick C1 protein
MGVDTPAGTGARPGFRERADDFQVRAFRRLGKSIGEHPSRYLLVPFCCALFSLGLFEAEVVVDLDDVWVAKGSRMDDERDFYTKAYGARPRTLLYSLVSRVPEGDVLNTAAFEDIIKIDRRVLDTRPFVREQPWGDGVPHCYPLNETQCAKQMMFCAFNSDDGVCEEADPYGVKPSFMNRGGITVEYLGFQWGLRELQSESQMPGGFPFRSVSSTVFTPLHCFAEAPDSMNPGMLRLQGWARNHPVSYKDEAARKGALGGECLGWTGSPIPKGYVMGGLTNNAAGEVVGVKAWSMLYPLLEENALVTKYAYIRQHPSSGPLFDALGYPETLTPGQARTILDLWEEKQSETENPEEYSTKVTCFNEYVLSQIVYDSAIEGTELIILGFGFMLLVVWSVTFDTSLVDSRLFLVGVGGVIIVLCAVAGSLGLACLLQIPLVAMSLQVLPYVCMGTGIDDMFILLHYFSTSRDRPVSDRMKDALAHAGPSVLATSSVNVGVFLLCALVPVNAIFYVAFQAAIATAFNFLCILFGFSALLALDAYRVQSNRLDLCCCIRRAEEQSEGAKESASQAHAGHHRGHKWKEGAWADGVEKWLAPIVTRPVGQAIVMILALGLLGVSIYGCMDPSVGLPATALIGPGATRDYVESQEKYMATTIAYVCGRPAEWWDPKMQQRLNELLIRDMMAANNAYKLPAGDLQGMDPDFLPGPSSWVLQFRKYAFTLGFNSSGLDPICFQAPPVNPTFIPSSCTVDPTKYLELLGFWLGETGCQSSWCDPLIGMRVGALPAQGSGAPYRDYVSVETDPTGTRAVGIKHWRSPFLCAHSVYGNEADEAVESMEEVRNLLDNSGLNLFAYGTTYALHEQYVHSVDTLTTALCLGLGAALVVVTVIGGCSLRMGLIVTMVLASGQVTFIAMLIAYGLKLNAYSIVSILFGIALGVEQTVHLARVFLVAQGNKAQRVTFALREMTGAILEGATTTFVAVLPLAWARVDFYYDYFFGMYASMVALSLFFALFPLPVLLCWFGPHELREGSTTAGPSATTEGPVPDSAGCVELQAVKTDTRSSVVGMDGVDLGMGTQ